MNTPENEPAGGTSGKGVAFEQRPNIRYTGMRRRELLLNYKKWLKRNRNWKMTEEKSKQNENRSPPAPKP